MSHELHITGDAEADELLSTDPLALLIGMLLDQQVPMETAFAGSGEAALAAGVPRCGEDRGARPGGVRRGVASGQPAVHRFPGSMAGRIQSLCAAVAETWGGDASAIWTRGAPDGATILKRLEALPGFGAQKAAHLPRAAGQAVRRRRGGLAGGRSAVRRGGLVPVGRRHRRRGITRQGPRVQEGGEGATRLARFPG
jgi:uncharacterized HhH-GPD family protein